MYAFRPVHVLQLVVGLVLLVATFAVLSAVLIGTVLLSVLAMLFALVPGFLHLSGWFARSAVTTLPPALNVIWLSAILGLILYGVLRSKPGYVAAPLVLCAIWFTASLMDRKRVEAKFAGEVWTAPVTPEARSQRTLIVETLDGSVYRGLTDRHIDRIIHVFRDRTQAVTRIHESTIVSCPTGRQAEPGQPQTFACSISREIADIPDGLVVERVRVPPGPVLLGLLAQDPRAQRDEALAHAAADPRAACKETQARLREHGQERVLLSWSHCRLSVLAYIPSFGFSDRPPLTSVWGFALGPAHPVVIGPADIAPEAMISAIYGIDISAQPPSRAASR